MRILEYAQLESTNLTAKEFAEKGDFGPLWIRADEQTGGRGRRGRPWVSVPGNLYCSGLYPHDLPPQTIALVSFVAALAVYETASVWTDAVRLTLKWPNDVLIGGAKTAGILLEQGSETGQSWLIVGIGINLVSHPDNTPYPATHLLQEARPDAPFATPQKALFHLSESFERWFSIFKNEGFSPIREAWLARAPHIPGPVTVKLPKETFTGEALGLSENGALQVKLANGTIRDVHAGDVFF